MKAARQVKRTHKWAGHLLPDGRFDPAQVGLGGALICEIPYKVTSDRRPIVRRGPYSSKSLLPREDFPLVPGTPFLHATKHTALLKR